MNLAPVLQLGLMLSDVRVDFGLQACWHLVLVGLRVLSAGTIPTLDGGLPAEVGVQVDDLIPAPWYLYAEQNFPEEAKASEPGRE